MVDSSTRQLFLDIANAAYAIPESINPTQFILDSIPLLGEHDGEFRERYVYGTLHRWIASEAISTDGLKRIHLALLGEKALFSGIGAVESDSVFLRAFAVLLLVPTLYMHRKQAFLSSEELAVTCASLSRYLREEKDIRGYVSPEKWWAHGIAHAADAVGQLVQCPELQQQSIKALLEAIAHAMSPETAAFAHEEDTRMASALLKLLKRDDVSVETIEGWLALVVPQARFEGLLPNVHIRYVNARNFVRCLFFQARNEGLNDKICALIEAAHRAFPDR